jgi:hypothetical protein
MFSVHHPFQGASLLLFTTTGVMNSWQRNYAGSFAVWGFPSSSTAIPHFSRSVSKLQPQIYSRTLFLRIAFQVVIQQLFRFVLTIGLHRAVPQ